jgi:hypothetical protein
MLFSGAIVAMTADFTELTSGSLAMVSAIFLARRVSGSLQPGQKSKCELMLHLLQNIPAGLLPHW